MIPWLSLVAHATPGSFSSTCAPPRVVAFWPAVGEVVPSDVVLFADEEGECGGNIPYMLGQAGFEPELLERENLGGGLVALHPASELAPGTWEVSTGYYDFATTFVVEAGAPLPPAAAGVDVDVTAEPRCGDASIAIVAEVTFEGADGVSLVELSWRTENGEQLATTELWEGVGPLVVTHVVAGQREACVTARLKDVAGAVVDEVDTCAEVEVCPDDPGGGGEEDAGCGCATASPGAGLLVLLVPLALRRRRAR